MSRASAGLHRTVPALPVRDVRAAAAHYRERFGFDAPHETDDFAVMTRDEAVDLDALFAELEAAGVLHPVSKAGVGATDFGTREFATLDQDGNLVTFFQWVSA
jgi:catechol 2,3-dioxygenase-like lactoylglutathione lyase family enzyme